MKGFRTLLIYEVPCNHLSSFTYNRCRLGTKLYYEIKIYHKLVYYKSFVWGLFYLFCIHLISKWSDTVFLYYNNILSNWWINSKAKTFDKKLNNW